MATLAQAEGREVSYPEKCRSVQARKKHKEKTIRDNPEPLYDDYIQLDGKRIKNNLIFYTTLITAWKSAICEEYKQPHSHHNLKARVEEERDEPQANGTDSEEEDPVKLSPSPSDHRLRDSLALLELDFTEFREHAQLKLSDSHNTNMFIQELKDELRQLKKDTNSSISELTRALRELKEENQTLRTQICKLEEDREKRRELLQTAKRNERAVTEKHRRQHNSPQHSSYYRLHKHRQRACHKHTDTRRNTNITCPPS
ncbi:hypothetical protein DPX16_0710 [Anabarilius grahami]|uniref:Uncharacterized protein n=1 Tax=Anabarilius grahami TaxID=495550 RepID=A0A3N0YC41_ANAGA|nr:hypothetical protein DPX16_0710 [Anabarilius grahami]